MGCSSPFQLLSEVHIKETLPINAPAINSRAILELLFIDRVHKLWISNMRRV